MINLRQINKRVLFVGVGILVIILIIILRLIGLKTKKSVSDEGTTTQTNQTNSVGQSGIGDLSNNQQENSATNTTNDNQENLGSSGVLTTDIKKKILDNVMAEKIDQTDRGDVLFFRNSDFHLIYFSKEDEYNISIFSPNFDQTRVKAEAKFLDILGVDKQTACHLTVFESTPLSVNKELGGQVFGLSFCK